MRMLLLVLMERLLFMFMLMLLFMLVFMLLLILPTLNLLPMLGLLTHVTSCSADLFTSIRVCPFSEYQPLVICISLTR
jgi:hypothetical protein